jgi:hypothetical protein
MQGSVLFPSYGRSSRFGHEADHLIAAPSGPEREDDQRLRWSVPMWSPPPESNRRPHPYHVSPAYRHAVLRLRRSCSSVTGTVMWWPLSSIVDRRTGPRPLPGSCCASRIVQRPALELTASSLPSRNPSPDSGQQAGNTRTLPGRSVRAVDGRGSNCNLPSRTPE